MSTKFFTLSPVMVELLCLDADREYYYGDLEEEGVHQLFYCMAGSHVDFDAVDTAQKRRAYLTNQLGGPDASVVADGVPAGTTIADLSEGDLFALWAQSREIMSTDLKKMLLGEFCGESSDEAPLDGKSDKPLPRQYNLAEDMVGDSLEAEAQDRWDAEKELPLLDRFVSCIDAARKILLHRVESGESFSASHLLQRAAVLLNQFSPKTVPGWCRSTPHSTVPGSNLSETMTSYPWAVIYVSTVDGDRRPWAYSISRRDLKSWLEVLDRAPAQFWGEPVGDPLREEGPYTPDRGYMTSEDKNEFQNPLAVWLVDYDHSDNYKNKFRVRWPELAVIALTALECYGNFEFYGGNAHRAD